MVFRVNYSSTCMQSTATDTDLGRILEQVSRGKLTPSESELMIRRQFENVSLSEPYEPEYASLSNYRLKSFAELDHERLARTGFPEVVFGEGKTPDQIAMILDDMARHFNEKVAKQDVSIENCERAILATRVSPDTFERMKSIPLSHGDLNYHPAANIVLMTPVRCTDKVAVSKNSLSARKKVVVITAGTTDIHVAEEAVVVLETTQCKVDRVFDVGVAGLHRILKALPKLKHHEVGCVIVCAGMDGALPSVVAGLVSCPVIAVPTR